MMHFLEALVGCNRLQGGQCQYMPKQLAQLFLPVAGHQKIKKRLETVPLIGWQTPQPLPFSMTAMAANLSQMRRPSELSRTLPSVSSLAL